MSPIDRTACCFELFGFDFLCDARGEPWLLEVNQDPSLATDTRAELDVKSAVLVDLLNLVGVGATDVGAAVGSTHMHPLPPNGWKRVVTLLDDNGGF